ncbi:MAG: putative Ig domain-containing protein [Acidobacteriia bacterium]|nr:putative Ig domain-containing protein [Terriglobia bacterium]
MTLLQRMILAGLALLAPAAFAQSIQGSLPDGTVNQPYNGSLTCTQFSTPSWSISAGALPPGLGLTYNSCSASITGTPSKPGAFSFTVTVIDLELMTSASRNFTVNIIGPLVITTPVILPAGVVNQNYNLQMAAAGGAGGYVWSVPSSAAGPNVLPKGMALSVPGVLSGIPTAEGNYGFDISVTDAANATTSAFFQLVVTPPMLITTASPLPTATVNTAYSQQINATGGTSPYTFSITTPTSAPPGMVISTGGVLGGVPKSTGSFTFTIQAADKNGYTTTKQFQISVAPLGPLLQTSLRSIAFSAINGGDTPPQQTLAITAPSGVPIGFLISVDSGGAGTAPPSWLTATPQGGPAPAAVTVAVNQGNLQPGKYSATIHVSVPNNNSQSPIDVPVTLSVASGTQQMTALPASLRFAARAVTPSAQDALVVIDNIGGGGAFPYSTSVVGKSSWISAVTPASGRISANAPATVRVFVNSAGLKTGFYHDTVRVTSTSGSVDVPVEFFVSDQGPVLGLSSNGLRFQARQGAGTSQAQSVTVLDLGDPTTTSAWDATLVSGSDWLSIATPNGTASQLRPGTLTLVPTANAATLSAGGHYALISVSDPGAINSPQYLIAVLDVAPATSLPLPDPSPGGLLFTTAASSPQNVTVFTSSVDPVAFHATAHTNDGNAWLAVTPASGNASTAAPGKLSVSVTPGSLPVGIYYGKVHVSMNGAMRSVNVTLIITTAGAAGTGFVARAAATCTASKLAVTETGMADNFAVPAGWPATLIVQVNDDCGNSIANASAVATFSNGDPPISLRGDLTSNVYSATWQPGVAQPEMTVTVRASSASLAAAVQQYSGSVNQNNSSPPSLVNNGALHIFFNVPTATALGAGLAPGNVAQVYGTGLASAAGQTVVPLPQQFNGTFMLIGSTQAPLFYVSDSLLNVMVPFELTPNRQYSLIVSANGALTMPETIDVTSLQPGVAQFPDGTVIAQISGTTRLITSTNPAKPGDNLTIYLAGMGPTTPPVASGDPTPLQLVPVNNQPTVTLDGQPVTYAYAGLTPTGIGLYQINLTVPANAKPGNLDLVVSQNGVAANTTKLPVSN